MHSAHTHTHGHSNSWRKTEIEKDLETEEENNDDEIDPKSLRAYAVQMKPTCRTSDNQNSNRKINRFIYYTPSPPYNSIDGAHFDSFHSIIRVIGIVTQFPFMFMSKLLKPLPTELFFVFVCVQTSVEPQDDKKCVLIFHFVHFVELDKHIDGTKSVCFKFIGHFSIFFLVYTQHDSNDVRYFGGTLFIFFYIETVSNEVEKVFLVASFRRAALIVEVATENTNCSKKPKRSAQSMSVAYYGCVSCVKIADDGNATGAGVCAGIRLTGRPGNYVRL